MKKGLILAGLILAGLCAFAQKEYTYSPKYVQHLKVCSKYVDEYDTTLSTGDVNSPYLKLKSTEEINGWLNGKCRTISTVDSYDLEKTILKIKCEVSRAQLAKIAQQMDDVNNLGTKESRKTLQENLTKMIEDSTVCKVKNYLEDDSTKSSDTPVQ